MHTCVGSVLDSPVMAFAWRRKQASPTSSSDFPVKRFWIPKKKRKRKNYNHKEKGFAVCTKGPSPVKSDSEMEPESGDNRAGTKKGRGARASIQAVAGPERTLSAQEGQSGKVCPSLQYHSAPPSPPSICPPPPQVGESKGVNPDYSICSCFESQLLH